MDSGRANSGTGSGFCQRSAAAAAEFVMETPASADKSAKMEQRACGQCGAKLDFAPGTSALLCPYCGFEQPVPQSAAPVAELDYQAFLEKAGGEKETFVAQRIQCDKCGAETTVPAEMVAGICPFCGANMVFGERLSADWRTLLPFDFRMML
jgi:predicted RNA-binding Zn-ribbon protein involved in translation (DUF1610 family)